MATGQPDDSARPSARTDLAVWLALITALVLLLQAGTPPREAVLALIVVAITLALSTRWRVGPVAIIVLLVVGIGLRSVPWNAFSDVLVVSEAASRQMLAGGSPYGVGFEASVPPGAPFAYGPLALLWYLPSLDDPGRMEAAASLVVLIALAVRGRPLGLAVYAVTPVLVISSIDGSNDTSAGLLILVSLLVAVRAPIAGAVLLALATAFKPYALAWLPGLIAYAGSIGPLAGFMVTTAVVWLPPIVAWGADSIVWSFREADRIHAVPYYSLAYSLEAPDGIPRELWQAFRIVVGVILAVLSLLLVRSVASLILMGTLVFCATLFLGWWGTFAYVAAVAPVICWHLDDWLGLGRQRVVWPGDPVRQVTDRADKWRPVQKPGRPFIDPTPSAG